MSTTPTFARASTEPAIELVPEIGRIKAELLALGAKAACMSGSGSAVFGIFADKAAAQAAQQRLTNVAFSCVCESN